MNNNKKTVDDSQDIPYAFDYFHPRQRVLHFLNQNCIVSFYSGSMLSIGMIDPNHKRNVENAANKDEAWPESTRKIDGKA